MKKVLKLLVLACLTAAFAMADFDDDGTPVTRDVPEIDGGMATSAAAMLSGALVMLRRKK